MFKEYKCTTCGFTRSIKSVFSPTKVNSEFPDSVPCLLVGCGGSCQIDKDSPEEILIKAKLAVTTSPSSVPILYSYLFRDNEQAAKLAISALEEAGYKIVPIKRTIVENLDKDGRPVEFKMSDLLPKHGD